MGWRYESRTNHLPTPHAPSQNKQNKMKSVLKFIRTEMEVNNDSDLLSSGQENKPVFPLTAFICPISRVTPTLSITCSVSIRNVCEEWEI